MEAEMMDFDWGWSWLIVGFAFFSLLGWVWMHGAVIGAEAESKRWKEFFGITKKFIL